VGSSNEVNSPVSFAITKNTGEKIEELNETMENLNLGDQLDDRVFMDAGSGINLIYAKTR
jgi:hypothetical protein